MCRILYKWRNFFLLLAGLLIAAQPSVYANESGNLQIHMDQKVIYCAARITVADNTFSLAMKDGILVTTEWHIQVGKVRDYWLNEEIADITVIRRAKPDLLTRSWLLTDTSSGISRRVYNIKDAIHFLSNLENFPVLDRSLLLINTLYRVSISIKVHAGEVNTAWWTNLWKPAASSMQQDFSLP
ncbi:MAG: DUF4390 domain-containing protein [Mariprofundus sp.]|nr:DUF4390 domain-containing protein [Mariprofundus sp.]